MVLLVLGILVLLALPVILLNLSFWKIRTITVSGNSAVPAESIDPIVAGDLQGTFDHLIPRANIIFFSKADIVRDVTSAFPRLLSVRVSITGFHSINVAVTERVPSALWCDNGNACYLMDASGIIFDHAPEIEGALYLVYRGEVGDASTTDLTASPLGAQFTTPAEFASLQTFAGNVKTLNLDPVSVTALGESEYEMALSGGEVIFFTTRVPIADTISNFESVLADPSLSLRSGSGLSVSSLDLRYGNKVFYVKKGK